MQMSWPGVGPDSLRDEWGNVLLEWWEKNERRCNKMLLWPWGKPMDQVRAEAFAFPGNVIVPEGWLYVCTHCGSRRMDKHGLASYSDEDVDGDPYTWDVTCIANAVLVSEEEYQEGRRVHDAQDQDGQGSR